MNILVTGANGQLGNSLRDVIQHSSHNYIFTDVAELDICNEQAVMDFVKANNIHLILLDIMMPVMDGITATARIHQCRCSRGQSRFGRLYQ